MIIGLPVAAMRRISGRSTISNDATLCTGTASSSRKSTALSSNAVEKKPSPRRFASSRRSFCHCQGVKASA
jgi:hypothetical protein